MPFPIVSFNKCYSSCFFSRIFSAVFYCYFIHHLHYLISPFAIELELLSYFAKTLLFVKMYEDAAELQVFFATERDVLCKDGQTFMSPALNHTKRMVLNQIEEEKRTKQKGEENDDEKTGGADEIKRQSSIDDILVVIISYVSAKIRNNSINILNYFEYIN